MINNSVSKILKTYNLNKHIIKKTILERNDRLSNLYNCNVFLKREDLQKVRNIVPTGKLAIGSGVTSSNVDAYEDLADILIVGTSFKFDNDVAKKVDINRVEELVRKIK